MYIYKDINTIYTWIRVIIWAFGINDLYARFDAVVCAMPWHYIMEQAENRNNTNVEVSHQV